MKIGVVTLFPQMFDAITQYGVSSRACKHGLIEISYTNPRDFAYDKHQKVDEKPFGGGPGMLMMVQPLRDAILKAKQALPKAKVVYLSPQGKRFSNEAAVNFSALEEVIFVSGRYEGIDERIIETLIDEEWSIGDYVLSGGELATMVMIDAIARFIPGVLGDSDSAQADSFAQGLLDYPQYTKPLEIDGLKVPDVLLSGNHELIRKWRLKEALGRTYERRPDLLNNLALTDEQEKLLAQYLKEHPQDATRKQ
ncbi:MAG: tRNA (guanosine(37)-N1)-methyltransferase TrmD [Succinivibrionaceae bacterium]|jgi:tRNA (guanine37-N1)-methyltransferase|nr:tRNA (guanosine(37)-N1)-methyltransferase TrmD [Ruminobacter sp.]MDY5779637.1 tRNA (guanosine(37)-N1)-methyltransferase TrmD [Succinivibrionaceae bacterium]MEE1339180.1 tRNA (guanosine(37)-N1)-methyltransferase TrmD [Succinivibrionaceae bacterium]